MKRFLRVMFTVLLTVIITGLTVALMIGGAFFIYASRCLDTPLDMSLFEIERLTNRTEIYYYEFSDRENRIGEAVLLSEQSLHGSDVNYFTEYKDVPRNLINAFVAIEDKRFFTHGGIDYYRTVGAGVNYFLGLRDSFGGSTITQQLIKNVTGSADYSIERKVREIFYAIELESERSKEEILELYLNVINLSQGCYGIGAASRAYFSKEVNELTLTECAAIAAITNSPTYYNPIRNPENNKQRRNLILRLMFEQEYISEAEYTAAKDEELVINPDTTITEHYITSWYTDMVIDDVKNDLIERLGYTTSEATELIYSGGLRIYTAMDIDIQEKLEEYYADGSNFPDGDEEGHAQSAFIVIDPKTGDILGVAGARGEKTASRVQNYATQTRRPSGSVIKPLSVYAPALEAGLITWSTVYDDTPYSFGNYNLDMDAGEIVKPAPWPNNATMTYRGLTNVNYAITHSLNTVSVKTLNTLGVKNSFYFLRDKLKMESLIERGTNTAGEGISDMDIAALALGQMNYGVTLREVTAAYSIFANGGVFNESRSYIKVTDSFGNILLSNDYKGEAVISEENAAIMTKMLENVIDYGTARVSEVAKTVDAAGKTGTTQDYGDRWFMGYTPYYIAGIWYGYEYPKRLPDNTKVICSTVWDEIMLSLHNEIPAEEKVKTFTVPEGLVYAEYCADSGKLVTMACLEDPRGDRSEGGWFTADTVPTESCDCHILTEYDISGGGVVDRYSGAGKDSYTVGLIRLQEERLFPMQIYIADAQYIYRELPRNVEPCTNPALPFFAGIYGEDEYCGISPTPTALQFNRYCRERYNYSAWLLGREN